VSEYPDFVIVCDHRIRGGHLDEVVRYTWPPHSHHPGAAHWGVPIPGPSGEVRQTQLAANRPGITSFFTTGRDLPRMHHEIICVTQHCRCRAYRSDVARLQTLFAVIAEDQTLRDVFTVSATSAAITVTLEALHLARDTAKRARGLDV
jgi:hypothetical protein